MLRRFITAVSAVVVVVSVSRVEASYGFADQVIAYTPGSVSSGYQDASAALGKPDAGTSFGVLTPFNAAWLGTQIVGVGPGGSVTLRLSQPAGTSGHTIGVHAGVGLIDFDWPNGFAGAVTSAYTNPRAAQLEVSEDAIVWIDLGVIEFENPTNYYADGVTTPGYQEAPGTVEADWGKPFTGVLSDFDGQTWPQVLATLDGSAGGTWPLMSASSLSQINYVRFSVPSSATHPMYVDAVVAIPEPGSLAVFTLLALLIRRRR